MKALVVVAHPDDELIWMGGFILRNKDWNWTIVSMCRKNDSDRKPKFDRVCKKLNALSLISDIDDENLGRKVSEMEIEKRLFGLLRKFDYDCIFTHGKNGEYGHIRHKEVHSAIKSLINSKKLKCRKAFYFNYIKDGSICIADKSSDFIIDLHPDELKMKKELVTKDYGFQHGSFEELCCASAESFKVEEI